MWLHAVQILEVRYRIHFGHMATTPAIYLITISSSLTYCYHGAFLNFPNIALNTIASIIATLWVFHPQPKMAPTQLLATSPRNYDFFTSIFLILTKQYTWSSGCERSWGLKDFVNPEIVR